jgi:hypothetical protein
MSRRTLTFGLVTLATLAALGAPRLFPARPAADPVAAAPAPVALEEPPIAAPPVEVPVVAIKDRGPAVLPPLDDDPPDVTCELPVRRSPQPLPELPRPRKTGPRPLAPATHIPELDIRR